MTKAQMSTTLSHKLGQRTILTPQLAQSLKLLAMSSMELEGYIEDCLERNPLLEIAADIQVQDLAAERNDSDAQDARIDEKEWQHEGDERWESVYQAPGGREMLVDSDQQCHDELSLGESLHEQINCQPMQESERNIAHALIDSLDDDGYFRSAPSELATSFNTSATQVIDVLEQIVQELEPAGIGSRDLTECLLLQLAGDDQASKIARRLLLHFSEDLLDDDISLARKAGCMLEDLQQARQRMRRLDAFPGHGLRGEPNIFVRPEIIFRRLNSGDIEVEVPQSGWRGVRISKQWQGHQWEGKDGVFMKAAAQEAKWLMHALDQRSDTLMRVGVFLAQHQRAFLEHGILGLKPLTLQDVAEQVQLHESTISRVTNEKYAHTPLGLINMRCFFSSGVAVRGGGMISVHRVQQRVKTLIQSEPADKPISDQAIADRLMAEGVKVARRTVGKYREQLGLPSSSQRKRAALLARTTQVRR
ncbi:MAG: RNA polymerase factor sigma-54 [Mariprofundaceae bacterium]|nr:RNA polymerase factor sigma-54 [Mariprofundaceae bacterium]